MHLPWMSVAGMMPGFPGQDVNRLLTDRAFLPRAFPQMGTNLNVVEVTATSTAAYHADLIECSNSSNITLSLHPAARMRGKVITIKKTGNNTNTVVIDPDSTETIDGETTITLFVRYDFLTLYSNGSNWQILSDGRYKHTAVLRREAAQSITTVTVTKILFDELDADTGGMGDLSNSRFVIKRTGNYFIFGYVRFETIGDNQQIQARYHVDEYAPQASMLNIFFSPGAGNILTATVTGIIPLAAAQIVDMRVYLDAATQNTGGGIDSYPRMMVQEM